MSMFNNFQGFDLMEWLAQGRRAGIDFSQLGRMQSPQRQNPRPEAMQPGFTQGQMPSRPPQVDPRQPDNSMFSMMDMLTTILSNSPEPRPQANVPPGSIPYEMKATDNYEGFYSTPYAPLKEGMTKEDLGKIIAGNLGASAGFK